MDNVRTRFEQDMIQKAVLNPEFRRELLANPHQAVERELGISVPESVSIKVVEEGPNEAYLVLPWQSSAKELSDEELHSAAADSSTWGPNCKSC
jgi:hypothetical protein